MGKELMAKKMRVFELARELNMPSKQLIQKMSVFGIVTESNFKGLSEEEIVFIKAKLSEAAGQATPSSDSSLARKGRIIRRAQVETPLSPAADTEKKPRRIRKKGKALEETLTDVVEDEISEERPSSKEIPPPKPIVEEEKEPIEAEDVSEKGSPPKEAKETEASELGTPIPQKSSRVEKEISSEKASVEGDSAPEKESDKVKRPAVEKKELKQQPIEFENFEENKRTPEKTRRGKKTARHSEEGFADVGFKKSKRSNVALSPDEEGETWEQRSRRKRNRRNRHKAKVREKKKHTFNPRQKSIKIGSSITVGELAGQIGIKVSDIIKKLMGMGVMATINQGISGENAALIASEFNIEVELVNTNKDIIPEPDQGEKFERAPIVTIMGHVDHGKTSLLDKIRTTQVTEGEAGGITQHIGAYRVHTEGGDITFLDTPGHEAFTAMRARGANVTDIVILVVAADDGVQPQTVEAIHHAQAAEVPIIVVINKVDRPEANPNRVQQELLEHSLVSEDFGGETIFVHASAKTGEGISTLLEMIHLQGEVLELKAVVEGKARGVSVIIMLLAKLLAKCVPYLTTKARPLKKPRLRLLQKF